VSQLRIRSDPDLAQQIPTGDPDRSIHPRLPVGGTTVRLGRFHLPLFAILFVVVCSGCRLSQDEVVGRYSVHSQDPSQPLALELSSDGTFTMYRSADVGGYDGEVSVYKSDSAPESVSGSGTWKLINQTVMGPGAEAVVLNATTFSMPLMIDRQDGLICIDARHDHNKESWCKS
jgi:hypothetical protein